VYDDLNTVEVAYQVRDSVGRAQVSTSSLMIQLHLYLVGLGSSITFSCGLPDGTGTSSCAATVPATWFSTLSDETMLVNVIAYSGVEAVAKSPVTDCTLKASPSYPSPSGVGMTLSLPHHPLFQGDTFTVNVAASTNGNVLTTWVASLTFSNSLFAFKSLTTSSLYVDAVYSASSNVLSFSTSGVNDGVTNSEVTGSSVPIVSVTFVVLTSAAVGIDINAMSLFVDTMVNIYSLSFGERLVGTVLDGRGGAYANGQVTVVSLKVVGILSYSNQNELVNTAFLDSVSISSPINVLGVYNKAGSTLVSVTDSSNCVGSDQTVLSVVGCVAEVGVGNSRGSASVPIWISYKGLNTSVSFRVWIPTSVRVLVKDPYLDRIQFGTSPVLRSGSLYQRSQIFSEAVFSCPGLSPHVAYVESQSTFSTTNTTIAKISGNYVVGKFPGSASVLMVSHSAFVIPVSGQVYVGASASAVLSLEVVVVTSLTSTSILSGIGPYGTVTPVYTAQQTFTSEGAVGFVVAYALFDDGHYMDVTSNVSVSSLSTSVGITYDASGALLTVRPGAVSLCGEVIEAT